MSNNDTSVEIFNSREKIRDELVKLTQEYLQLESLNLEKQDYISYLINIISIQTANLLFYNSSVYREFFLTKAVQKESVDSIAAMLGYSQSLATPATAEVLVTINVDFTSSATITLEGVKTGYEDPLPYKFKAGNIVFSPKRKTIVDLVVSNGTLSAATITEYLDTGGTRVIPSLISGNEVSFLIEVTQTESNSFQTVVPTLKPYEFYSHRETIGGSVSGVFVTSNIPDDPATYSWTSYPSLYMIDAGVLGYVFRIIGDDVKFFFGNDLIGESPGSGTTINLLINTTSGSEGNVISGSIIDPDKIYIVDSVLVSGVPTNIRKKVKITCVNVEPSSGGKDSPTIDEVRSQAILGVTTKERVVSEYDYENISGIVKDFPIRNSIPILKQSDLKQNEVAVFTDLIYEDTVVPMRNEAIATDATNGYQVKAGDAFLINGESYNTLFDISVDLDNKTTEYKYIIEKRSAEVNILKSHIEETRIHPSQADFKFTTIGITDYIEVKLSYSKVRADDYSSYTATATTVWDGTEYVMGHFYDDTNSIYYFYANIPLSLIEEGDVTFNFDLYDNTAAALLSVESKILITKNMRLFMNSNVDVIRDATTNAITGVTVYDVPLMKTDFYESIDTNAFAKQIYDKIILFNPASYKMLTEFMNLKFSNTTGKSTNMLLNKTQHLDVIKTNPVATDIATPVGGDRYAVSSDINPWGRTGGFIATYSSTDTTWKFKNLSLNDMFTSTEDATKLLYNGTVFVTPIQSIPLDISLIVFKNKSYSYSDQSISNSVKNAIIDSLYNKFGYNKTIYISMITDAVNSVTGVDGCRVLKPSHDIFFNFDPVDDLTATELSTYTPELIFIDTRNITIEVR